MDITKSTKDRLYFAGSKLPFSIFHGRIFVFAGNPVLIPLIKGNRKEPADLNAKTNTLPFWTALGLGKLTDLAGIN